MMTQAKCLLLLIPALSSAQFLPNVQPTGVLRTGTLNGNQIYYIEDGGSRVFEGDILLGAAESAKSGSRTSSVVTGAGVLWTNLTIPFVFDSDVANQTQIMQAMQVWTAATNIQFVARTTQANYIRIQRPATVQCNSYVGMIGGAQTVNMHSECSPTAHLHELGHAIGLWHEQTRQDRDDWITFNPQNVNKLCIHNYDRQPNARDSGAYDFASIMHYTPSGYSAFGLPTMETIPPGIPIGDTAALSAGDIANVRALYGQSRKIFVSTFPAGLPVIVDGSTVTATQSFDWAVGSTHTLAAADANAISADTRLLFGRWSDNGARSHTITVDAAATSYYTASYIRQFRVTTAVEPAGSGTVDLSPASTDGFYADRTAILATARPGSGQYYWRWRGIDKANAGTYFEDASFAVGNTNPRYFALIGPKDIVFMSSTIPVVIIDTDPPNLQIVVDGQQVEAPFNFRNAFADGWQPGSSHTLGIPATTQLCNGKICPTDTRYVFQGWSQGGGTAQTIAAPTGAARYTAKFQQQFLVSTFPSLTGSVRVSPASTDGYYAAGTLLTVTPTATSTARFRDWFGQTIDVDLPGAASTRPAGPCSAPAQTRLATPLYLTGNFELLASFTPPPPPAASANAIQNGASFATGAVAPGEIITLYGANFGPAGVISAAASFDGFLDNCLNQTTFLFDGVAAPVIYNSPGQAAVIVPYAVAGKASTSLVVDNRGTKSTPVTIPVVASAPGIFSVAKNGLGPGLFFHADYTAVTTAKPAEKGESIFFYATGEGQTSPGGIDGYFVVDLPRLAKPVLAVEVTIGGEKAEVQYVGSAPNFISGLMQVNIQVPLTAPSGSQNVILKVGSAASPGTVTLAVR